MTPQEFDLINVPLTGANLIEAGAGTGKTYNITGLYLRLLLESNLSVDQILVMTFTVAATEELKDRIRNKIIEAIAVLKSGKSADSTLEALTRRYENRQAAIDKLEYSLRQFDEAAIFTIHGFCSRVLNDYTFESNTPFNTEFINNQTGIVHQAVHDFWRKYIAGKSLMFLQYLINVEKLDTPEKLQQSVASHYTRQFLTIIPQINMPEIETLEADFIEQFTRLKEAWPESYQEVKNILLTNESLNRSKYSLKRIPQWLEDMDITLKAINPDPGMFKYFEKFTTGVINDSLKKNTTEKIYHPFFELCEKLNNSRTALLESYRNSVIAIKYKLYDFIGRELTSQKREANVQYYDDLLLALYHSLQSSLGNHLASLIRRRYRAALIDEFQDTDPIQYSIFKKIFKHEDSILFLIGDPKQAIYAFRGADIFAYIEAVNEVDSRYTLSKNWRSHPKLIAAINAVYDGVSKPFVFEDIEYYPASSAKSESDESLVFDKTQKPPLELWYLDSRNPGEQYINRGLINKGAAVDFLTETVTAEIVSLLEQADQNTATIGNRPLKASDIAILVRKNNEATTIKRALDRHNIPSILYSDKSVFNTEEAVELLRVLLAIAEPTHSGSIKAALTTAIFGLSGEEIYQLILDDTLWENWLSEFKKYNYLWREYGFFGMLGRLLIDRKVRSKILQTSGGERRLTNILHLGELLHNRISHSQCGVSALVSWFKAQIQGDGDSGDNSQLRLESDENAVKIVTIHKSKGLEYDIVFCPFAWGGSRLRKSGLPLFHDSENDNTITLDLGSERYERNKSIAERELLAENARLLYVALTRAKYRLYLGWGLINTAESSALAYTLHQPNINEPSNIVDETEAAFKSLSDDTALSTLADLATHAGDSIDIKTIPTKSPSIYKPLTGMKDSLAKLEFKGSIDREWRITSFSNLSTKTSELSELPDHDWLDHPVALPRRDIAVADTETIFDFPKGARAGTFCHELFENIDFTDIKNEYTNTLINDKLKQFGFDLKWHDIILGMLDNTINVPLAADSEIFSLAEIPKDSKLNELEFHFPLNKISAEKLNRCFEKYNVTTGSTFNEITWRKLNFQPVKGYLKGFIDLVFRYDNRYYLLDWKSNHLGNSIDFYNRESLTRVMADSYYFLQYHLYAVALHKYLSLRLENYDYSRDFGGVFYLFLRGIDKTPTANNGIFYDKPSIELISELTSILIPGTDSE